MRRFGRRALSGLLLSTLPLLISCSAYPTDAPEQIGEDYPSGGVPTQVAWPSDWLEGFVSESEAVGGTIVGLRLEYQRDRWIWRLTSHDPKLDWTGDRVSDPNRGRESIIDATDLSLLQDRHVQLPEEAMAPIEVGTAEAARLSGETYPTPRLVELELGTAHGAPVWEATLMDLDTGALHRRTVHAVGDGEAMPPAKP